MNRADLKSLLARLDPILDPEEYAFCCLRGAVYGEFDHLEPVAAVAEREGLTLIVEHQAAKRHGLTRSGAFRRITLQVASSLESFGLTAAVSRLLAENGIACNMIAGFHHDHLYVPAASAEKALALLRELQDETGNS